MTCRIFYFLLLSKANKNHLLQNVHFLKASEISTSVISVFQVICNYPRVTEVKLDGTKIHTAIFFFFFFKSKKGIYFQAFRLFLSDLKEHRCTCSIRFIQFSSVESLSRVRLFPTPWIAACQASLSITISWSSLKLMFISILQYLSFLRFWNNWLKSYFFNGSIDVNMSVLDVNANTDATNVL